MINFNVFLLRRIKSFGYALSGLATLFRDETNAKIHLVAACVAIVGGVWLEISGCEWIAVIVCIQQLKCIQESYIKLLDALRLLEIPLI